MQRIFLVSLMGLLFGIPTYAASAFFYTGNYLASLMAEYQKAMKKDSSTNYSDAWTFRAYVIGVHDTGSGILFCPPSDLGETQAPSTVAQFLESHPEQWNKPGADLVISALQNVYPCPKKP